MRANFYSNKTKSDDDRFALTTESGYTQANASVPVNPSFSNLKVLRQGLSVQELKAITARRIACSGESTAKPARKPGAYVNPAGTYQTATPQQLEAAGIKPIILPNQNRPQDRLHAAKDKEWDINDKHQPLQHSALHLIGGNEFQPPKLVKQASDPHFRSDSTRRNIHSSSTSYSNHSSSIGNGSHLSGRQYNTPYQPNPASIRPTLLPNPSLQQDGGVNDYPPDRSNGMAGQSRYAPTIRATTRRLMETGESLVGNMLHDDLSSLSIFSDDNLSISSIDAGRERATALLPPSFAAPLGHRGRREEASKLFPISNSRQGESTVRGQQDFTLSNKPGDYHMQGAPHISTMTPWVEEEGLASRASEHLDDGDAFSTSPRSQETATAAAVNLTALSPLFPPLTTKNAFFDAAESGSAPPLAAAPRKLDIFRKSNSQSSIITLDIASVDSTSSPPAAGPVDYNGHPVLGSAHAMQAKKAREMFLNRSHSESLLQLSLSSGSGGGGSQAGGTAVNLPSWGATANIPFTNSSDAPMLQEPRVRARPPPGLGPLPSVENASLALEMAESVFSPGLDSTFESSPSNPVSVRSTLESDSYSNDSLSLGNGNGNGSESKSKNSSPAMTAQDNPFGMNSSKGGSRLINGMYGRR